VANCSKAVPEQALDPCSMIGKPENPAPVAALMTAGGSLGPVGVLNRSSLRAAGKA